MQPMTEPRRPAWSARQLVLALRTRNYRLLFAGRLVGFLANGAYATCTTYLVWQITGQALPTTMVMTIQFAPSLLFGAWFGSLVDRFPRRRAMIVQQAAGFVLSAAMATLAVTGAAQLWSVYLILFASGVLTAWSNPLQTALIGQILPEADARKSGTSLNSFAWQNGLLLGAALAGALIPALGVGTVMWIAPAAALATITALSMIRERELAPVAPGRGRSPVLEGVRYLGADADLMAGLVLGAVVGMVAMGAIQAGANVMLMSEFARTPDEEARVLGWAGAAVAAGGILSQLLTGGGGYTPSGRLLARIVTGLGVVIAAAGLFPYLPGVLVLLAVASLLAYSHQTTAQLVNLQAPRELQGRISGLWFAVSSGGKAVAGLLVGVLAEVLGPRGAMVACAVLLLAAATAVTAVYRQRRRRPSTASADPRP
jgi:MFS family permease